MVVNIETSSFIVLPLDKIVSKLPVRRLSVSGLKRIQESMKKVGFLENYPIVVAPLEDGTYLLIDGNHRYESAKEEGIALVPCLVKHGMSEDEMYRMAIQSNSASVTSVPMTLVSYAEFVWERSKEGKTQEDIAGMLGWKRGTVSNYALLDKIGKNAWEIIATTFEKTEETYTEDAVASIATGVAFSEFLLRSILDLTSDQQLELVQSLAHPDKDQRITKGKFTELAKAYQGRNEMRAYATTQLGDLGEEYITQLNKEIDSGAYDAEWQKSKDEKSKSFGQHSKLDKLIETIHAEWEQKNSIYLTHGDFYEEVKKVGDGKVDLILTDPPYNIANERKFTFDGRTSISQNFGEWDKYSREQFIALFDMWAQEWNRILREGGSGYVFTSDIYLSYLIAALERAELDVKTSLVWHKTNPAPQMIQTTFQSAVEYIIFFVKGKDYTFNWQGNEGEMHNFVETPNCGGNERLQDTKKKTLHPTQKPVQVLKHLIEVSTNRGDTIFDGFAGVGSSGRAAKDLGRKFIGIEQDITFFEAMQRRLTND